MENSGRCCVWIAIEMKHKYTRTSKFGNQSQSQCVFLCWLSTRILLFCRILKGRNYNVKAEIRISDFWNKWFKPLLGFVALLRTFKLSLVEFMSLPDHFWQQYAYFPNIWRIIWQFGALKIRSFEQSIIVKEVALPCCSVISILLWSKREE